MAQFVREYLSLNDTGWTRAELRAVVRGRVEFRAQFQRNPTAYTQMIWRLISRGDIEDRGEKLFASERTRLSVVVWKELFELRTDGLCTQGR
jgi:hypothetical protein